MLRSSRPERKSLGAFLSELEKPEVKEQVFAEGRQGLSFEEIYKLDAIDFDISVYFQKTKPYYCRSIQNTLLEAA